MADELTNEDMGALVYNVLTARQELADARSHLLCQASRLRGSADAIDRALADHESPIPERLTVLERNMENHQFVSYNKLADLLAAAVEAAHRVKELEDAQERAGIAVMRHGA